jgi:hypothetical protein
MDRNHIPVMPMLGGKKHTSNKTNKSSNIDPDVNTIIKHQNNDTFNVLKMNHEPTDEENKYKTTKGDEEKEEKEEKKSNENKVIGYSWLVLSLAVIVIILIIFIVWWVLGENKETKKIVIPPGIIKPHNILPGLPKHDVYPVFRTQSEQMPIQTQNMPNSTSQTSNTKDQPSKKELEMVLSQINMKTIPEEKKINRLKPNKVKQASIEVVDEIVSEVESTEVESTEVESTEVSMDDALVVSFNARLQSDVDNNITEE